ncbi:MAG TPA: acyltransferase [Steroidobacteraceae bacterium]
MALEGTVDRIVPASRSPLIGEAASVYLDALRAVAANLVIASHVLGLYFGIGDPYALGHLGVAVFFLLSGFLIMQSMLKWAAHGKGPMLPGFLADRLARVLTPYVPALLLIAGLNAWLIEGKYGAEGSSAGVLAFFGNLLLLQDHSVFQLLELVGLAPAWRIRSYNAAEPFWTVAVEMWIYVSMGLFFFCLMLRERVRKPFVAALALVSFPVLVWNAAAGGGKSLTLIWVTGAIAGMLFHFWRPALLAAARPIACALITVGLVAVVGRVGKIGFQPYDFQTAALLAFVMFGVLAWLLSVRSVPASLKRAAGFLASYSYSLYLVHNTVLIVILELLPIESTWLRVAIAVASAHCVAYLLYLSFERHYRTVAAWLRPKLESLLSGVRARTATSSNEPPAPSAIVSGRSATLE